MKNNDLNESIEMLEKQLQYLYTDYKGLLNQHNTLNNLRALKLQIKQAEESLRLKKRIRYITLN